MNYCVKHLSTVPEHLQQEVREFCEQAIKDSLQVAIVLEDLEYRDGGTETVLYGCYSNTDEWVRNYDQNGGTWAYFDPHIVLAS